MIIAVYWDVKHQNTFTGLMSSLTIYTLSTSVLLDEEDFNQLLLLLSETMIGGEFNNASARWRSLFWYSYFPSSVLLLVVHSVQIAVFCLRIIMDGPKLTFLPSSGPHHPTK